MPKRDSCPKTPKYLRASKGEKNKGESLEASIYGFWQEKRELLGLNARRKSEAPGGIISLDNIVRKSLEENWAVPTCLERIAIAQRL